MNRAKRLANFWYMKSFGIKGDADDYRRATRRPKVREGIELIDAPTELAAEEEAAGGRMIFEMLKLYATIGAIAAALLAFGWLTRSC